MSNPSGVGFATHVFRLLALATIVIGAPAYLAWKPEDYSPALECLLNIALVYFSFEVARTLSTDDAVLRANQKWMPQAESACKNLLTIWKSVLGFKAELASMCGVVAAEIPSTSGRSPQEAFRVALDGRCQSGAQRLDDIANHLRDAVTTWEQFLLANCEGDNCNRIIDAIKAQEARLAGQLPPSVKPNCESPGPTA